MTNDNMADIRRIAEQLKSAAGLISEAAEELLTLVNKGTDAAGKEEIKTNIKINTTGIDVVALRKLAEPLIRNRKSGLVREVLKEFNADSLPQVKPEDYNAVYLALEELNGKA